MKNAAPRPGHEGRHHVLRVIRGLDPRIHRSSQKAFFEVDGLPGRSPAMTACLWKRGRSIIIDRRKKPMPRSAIHPGEILADELNELEITPTELSRQLSVPSNRISQIIQGKRAITGDTALRLGHWFQTSAQFWLNLQSAYDLRVATDQIGR
jgi:addiction module HigA family antidote